MNITNKYGLPGAIVQAIKNDDYDPGESDITVTQLIGPPQIRILLKQHPEIEQDASDMLWALMGKAMHHILELAEPSAIVEERLYLDVLGWKVGGKFDRLTLTQTTLQDYKLASVYEAINGLKPEREAQLNALGELAVSNGYPVKRLEIVHLGRDWSASRAEREKDYPPRPVQRISVPLWSQEKRRAYLEERVSLHQAAAHGDIAPCSDEERWYRGEQWAVMKDGRQKAVKLCANQKEADALVAQLGDKHRAECRSGENIRCRTYCAVSSVCPQWAALNGAEQGHTHTPGAAAQFCG